MSNSVPPKNSGKYARPKRKSSRKPTVVVMLAVAAVLVASLIGIVTLSRGSPYDEIVRGGYSKSQEQFLASLVGESIAWEESRSAFEIARENGYQGSLAEWTQILTGSQAAELKKSTYETACENGYAGTLAEWLETLVKAPETLGHSGHAGEQTEYELACEYGYSGTFIEWLISISNDRVYE